MDITLDHWKLHAIQLSEQDQRFVRHNQMVELPKEIKAVGKLLGQNKEYGEAGEEVKKQITALMNKLEQFVRDKENASKRIQQLDTIIGVANAAALNLTVCCKKPNVAVDLIHRLVARLRCLRELQQGTPRVDKMLRGQVGLPPGAQKEPNLVKSNLPERESLTRNSSYQRLMKEAHKLAKKASEKVKETIPEGTAHVSDSKLRELADELTVKRLPMSLLDCGGWREKGLEQYLDCRFKVTPRFRCLDRGRHLRRNFCLHCGCTVCNCCNECLNGSCNPTVANTRVGN